MDDVYPPGIRLAAAARAGTEVLLQQSALASCTVTTGPDEYGVVTVQPRWSLSDGERVLWGWLAWLNGQADAPPAHNLPRLDQANRVLLAAALCEAVA